MKKLAIAGLYFQHKRITQNVKSCHKKKSVLKTEMGRE